MLEKAEKLDNGKSYLNSKIKRIQKVFKGCKQREKLPKKINRDKLNLFTTKLLNDRKIKNRIKIQTAARKFFVRKKLEELKKNTLKIQKIFKGCLTRKKLNLKEKRNKAIKLQATVRKFFARKKLEKLKKNTTEIQKMFRGFLIRKKLKPKKKMTKICKWLFVGFVISLVAFMFEMFVFDVAFLSILSISTLLVAIILTAIFLYIDHKFKIFFWKRKPPVQMITESPIQIESVLSKQNSIINQINITENNKNSNPKPREKENIEKGNIIDTSNQINLNEQDI